MNWPNILFWAICFIIGFGLIWVVLMRPALKPADKSGGTPEENDSSAQDTLPDSRGR